MVKLAKTAGFCYGVDRAVKLAETEAEKGGEIYTLGPIIHNPYVVENLKKKGVMVVDSAENAKEGVKIVVRSHGISRREMETLEGKGCEIIDATCPFVKKIHNVVAEYSEKGYSIIVAGDEKHPEVQGILGWCSGAVVIDDENQVTEAVLSDDLVCVVSQTTFERKKWEKIKE